LYPHFTPCITLTLTLTLTLALTLTLTLTLTLIPHALPYTKYTPEPFPILNPVRVGLYKRRKLASVCASLSPPTLHEIPRYSVVTVRRLKRRNGEELCI
jgi:hypothetical protein